MNIDPSLYNNLASILLGLGILFLVSFWLALVIWTARDIHSRVRNLFIKILAVLLVALLLLPGLLIYLVLRPTHTLEEEYQRTLEENALVAGMENQDQCPGCERRVQPDWQVCPDCHTILKKTCQNCGKLLELPWVLCPYCASPIPGMKIDNLPGGAASPGLPLNKVQVDSPIIENTSPNISENPLEQA